MDNWLAGSKVLPDMLLFVCAGLACFVFFTYGEAPVTGVPFAVVHISHVLISSGENQAVGIMGTKGLQSAPP